MRKTSKDFIAKVKQYDPKKTYSAQEALELAKKFSYEKFDASVEVHVRTGIDPKKGDQIVRGTIVLPHGTGKSKKVAVFAEGDAAAEATREGADIVGGKELIQEIKQSGKADFEAAIATPDMMKHLAIVAKVLGPKGLMPSPKNDTVTNNVGVAIKDIKRGKVTYKNDHSGNIHQVIGKKSFETAQLLENYTSFMDALRKSKPPASKGTFIRNISLSTSMGPGIKVELS